LALLSGLKNGILARRGVGFFFFSFLCEMAQWPSKQYDNWKCQSHLEIDASLSMAFIRHPGEKLRLHGCNAEKSGKSKHGK